MSINSRTFIFHFTLIEGDSYFQTLTYKKNSTLIFITMKDKINDSKKTNLTNLPLLYFQEIFHVLVIKFRITSSHFLCDSGLKFREKISDIVYQDYASVIF